MVCKGVHTANLFKTNPNILYINWAAGMQIQFSIEELDQSYTDGMERWAKTIFKNTS